MIGVYGVGFTCCLSVFLMGHSSGCQGILERAFAFAPIFGVAGGDGFGINSVERQRSIELVLREVPQSI